MRDPRNTTHTDRLATQAEAKKALLAKFKAKPMVTAPDSPSEREAARRAELERVRAARQAERDAKRNAVEAAETAKQQAEAAAQAERDNQRKLSQREQLLALYGRKRGNR